MNQEYIDHLQDYLRKISNHDCIPDDHKNYLAKLKNLDLNQKLYMILVLV